MSASMYVGRIGGLAIGLGIGVAIGAGMSAASAAPSEDGGGRSAVSTPRPAAAVKSVSAKAVVSPVPRILSVSVSGYGGLVRATGAAPLTYSGTSTKGTVGFINPSPPYAANPQSPYFSFLPGDGVEHAAAKIGAPYAALFAPVTFTVTNNVYPAKPATKTVNVRITPTNDAPVYSANNPFGTADPVTGKTFGDLTGVVSDADNDTLSFYGTKNTAQGMFTLAKAGTFTFAPTWAARHAAALTTNPVDEVSIGGVTVDDGYKGGKVALSPLTIAIAPVNRTPAAENYSVGTPSVVSSTTTVTGTIFGTDADGDTLNYTIVSGPSYGTSVNVNLTSGVYTFIYNNQPADINAATGITPDDTLVVNTPSDGTITFIVQVNDLHNGDPVNTGTGLYQKTVTVPVTVTLQA